MSSSRRACRTEGLGASAEAASVVYHAGRNQAGRSGIMMKPLRNSAESETAQFISDRHLSKGRLAAGAEMGRSSAAATKM